MSEQQGPPLLQLSPYETALLYVTAGDARGPRLVEAIINAALSHLAALGLATPDDKAVGFAWTITEVGKDYLAALAKETLQ